MPLLGGVKKRKDKVMPQDISVERAMEIISSAFKPFRCDVDLIDHRKKVKFKVMRDAGATVLAKPEAGYHHNASVTKQFVRNGPLHISKPCVLSPYSLRSPPATALFPA